MKNNNEENNKEYWTIEKSKTSADSFTCIDR